MVERILEKYYMNMAGGGKSFSHHHVFFLSLFFTACFVFFVVSIVGSFFKVGDLLCF